MRSRQEALTPVDDRALSLAASLFAHAHQGALAFLSPSNGWPQVSRVAVGRDAEGIPLILISGLSAHFAALSHDPRCCLLLGEPGSGDPLAHPRISVDCRAVRIPDVDKPSPRDAFVAWDSDTQQWVLSATYKSTTCHACDAESDDLCRWKPIKDRLDELSSPASQ